MLTYWHSLNQLKMVLNSKNKLFKNRKSSTKTIITEFCYDYFFD